MMTGYQYVGGGSGSLNTVWERECVSSCHHYATVLTGCKVQSADIGVSSLVITSSFYFHGNNGGRASLAVITCPHFIFDVNVDASQGAQRSVEHAVGNDNSLVNKSSLN